MGEFVAYVNESGRIVWIAPETAKAMFFTVAELLKHGLPVFARPTRDDRVHVLAVSHAARTTGGVTFESLHELGDGRLVRAVVTVRPISGIFLHSWRYPLNYGDSPDAIDGCEVDNGFVAPTTNGNAIEPLRITDAAASNRPSRTPLMIDIEEFEAFRLAEHYSEREIRMVRSVVGECALVCGWQSQADITTASIREWLTECARQGNQRGTRNNKLSLVSRFLSWSKEVDKRKDRPDKDIQRHIGGGRRRGKDKGQSAFTWNEICRLVAVGCVKRNGRYDTPRGLIYALSATTGLRRGELEQLEDGMLDAVDPVLWLPSRITKSGTDQAVYLVTEVEKALREWISARDQLGVTFEHMPWYTTVRLDMDRAGIPINDRRGRKRSFKSLRSGFNTAMAVSGVDLQTRQAAMRHTDPRLTACTYLDEDQLKLLDACKSLPQLWLEENIKKNLRKSDDALASETQTDDTSDVRVSGELAMYPARTIDPGSALLVRPEQSNMVEGPGSVALDEVENGCANPAGPDPRCANRTDEGLQTRHAARSEPLLSDSRDNERSATGVSDSCFRSRNDRTGGAQEQPVPPDLAGDRAELAPTPVGNGSEAVAPSLPAKVTPAGFEPAGAGHKTWVKTPDNNPHVSPLDGRGAGAGDAHGDNRGDAGRLESSGNHGKDFLGLLHVQSRPEAEQGAPGSIPGIVISNMGEAGNAAGQRLAPHNPVGEAGQNFAGGHELVDDLLAINAHLASATHGYAAMTGRLMRGGGS